MTTVMSNHPMSRTAGSAFGSTAKVCAIAALPAVGYLEVSETMLKSFLLLLAVFGLVSCSHEGVPVIATEMDSLVVALRSYKAEFGALPAGTDSTICKALSGENAKKLKFIEMRPSGIDGDGRFLDPWGTPYRFYFSDDGILVRSAGPNRQFDDQRIKQVDDYYRSNTET